MTPLQQSLLISGSIFILMVATQFGRRAYKAGALARPVLICGVVGYFYLKDAPTDSVDFLVYGAGAVIGGLFGYIAYRTTKIERDDAGIVRTVCGAGFVAIWLIAVLSRIVFIILAEHNDAFHNALGTFMYNNQIVEAVIAPFFVLMALAMVVVRIVLITTKVNALPKLPANELASI